LGRWKKERKKTKLSLGQAQMCFPKRFTDENPVISR
jgi:hypothetical protein